MPAYLILYPVSAWTSKLRKRPAVSENRDLRLLRPVAKISVSKTGESPSSSRTPRGVERCIERKLGRVGIGVPRLAQGFSAATNRHIFVHMLPRRPPHRTLLFAIRWALRAFAHFELLAADRGVLVFPPVWFRFAWALQLFLFFFCVFFSGVFYFPAARCCVHFMFIFPVTKYESRR